MKKILFAFVAISLLGSCSITKKKKTPEKPSYKVLLETTAGNITIQLYKDVPKHANNFLKLTKEGYYDSVLFHRVIPQFMIQGGDPNSKQAAKGTALGGGDIGYLIPAEFKVEKYIHKKGALAAARTGNPLKESSGCQFYIVEGKKYKDSDLDNFEKQKGFKYTEAQRNLYKTIGGTPHLDNEYTVYGEVIEGLDIVTKISKVRCAGSNRPVEDVRIIKARVIR
jgi:peptidyl-prolyl cis-trans isomerase B (cyclophilin B)